MGQRLDLLLPIVLLAAMSPFANADELKPLAEVGQVVPDAIFRYVEREEPDYSWTIDESIENQQGAIHQAKLVSQKWHDVIWEHDLYIYEPKVVRHPTKVLLYINGGRSGRKPNQSSMEIGQALANVAGARVASLHQVPNQPILNGRYEDDAISETWLNYLETGDETWPLLFPMVKSAVKAMDAVQEMALEHRNIKVDGFVITGASKRGWTSWLTPVVDERIVGTAPMVIDMLNLKVQMRYQMDMWGKFSDSIRDYTEKGLVKLGEETEREQKLRVMMDPYTYRSRLTLPKLIVNGANDPYWCTDALNNYWDGLEGDDNHVLQLPNAGHGLDGKEELALKSIAMFFDSVASGEPFPKLEWTWNEPAGKLTIIADPMPKRMQFWKAVSKDKDFRNDRFVAEEIVPDGNTYTVVTSPIDGVYQVIFAEASYERGPIEYSQTTQIWRVD
ncbi:MAG: PhoPQ-activated protein PqaA family protein [Planctomycetota bacterium]